MTDHDLDVRVMRDPSPELVESLTRMEEEAFGEAGLTNESLLVPFIRHGRVFALYVDGRPRGVAEYMRDWQDPHMAYLYGISVQEEYTGQGLGTAFLARSLKMLADEDVHRVHLTVDPENEAAIRVYEKLGFRRADFQRSIYGPGEDRLIMEASLLTVGQRN